MPEGPSGWVSDSGSEYRPSSAWDITDVDEHAELDPEDLELALGYLPGGAQPRTEGNGADIEEPPEVDEDVESVVSDATTTGLTVPGDRSDVASDTDDDSDIAVWLGDKGKQNASELPSLEEVPPRRLTERQRRREQRNAREQEIADFRGATIGVANEAFNDTLRIVLGKGEGSHDDSLRVAQIAVLASAMETGAKPAPARIRKYHELSPDDDLELDEDDDPNIPLIKGDFDPILEESSKPSAEIDAVKALYDELRTVIRDVWHSESLRETGPPPPIELDERPDEQPATSHTSNRQQPMPIPGELESELREKTVSVIDQVLQQVAQVRETICEGHDPGMILRSDWESILNAAVLCNLPENVILNARNRLERLFETRPSTTNQKAKRPRHSRSRSSTPHRRSTSFTTMDEELRTPSPPPDSPPPPTTTPRKRAPQLKDLHITKEVDLEYLSTNTVFKYKRHMPGMTPAKRRGTKHKGRRRGDVAGSEEGEEDE